MKQNLDKYFRQKLDVPQAPPEDAWDFIQKKLPKEKEKKKAFPFWLRSSGIAASLLLMVGFGYWLGSHNNSVSGTPELVINPSENKTHAPSGSELINDKNIEGQIPHYLEPNSSQNNFDSHQEYTTDNQTDKTYSKNNYSSQNSSVQFTNSTNFNQNDLNFDAFYSNSSTNSTPLKTFQASIAENQNQSGFSQSWNNSNLNLNPIASLHLPTLEDAKIADTKNEEFLLVLNEKSNEENKKKKKQKIDFDRFYISAFASPLAFNTFVGNSMLADEMSQYHTENSVTLAYGVKAAYSLTPKLKIRTGVSVVGLEQITNDVPLAVDLNARNEATSIDQINNIKYNGSVRIDNQTASSLLAATELTQKSGYGNMQQQTSYIEIPLEAELNLFETNSIGISATGGGSTWVLSKNKIYVHTDDYTQELGEANNLNDVTFSANAGLKFDMKLSDKVKLNVEPNFRYLVNPVNNIEKYNPYTVGVNAGVSVSLK